MLPSAILETSAPSSNHCSVQPPSTLLLHQPLLSQATPNPNPSTCKRSRDVTHGASLGTAEGVTRGSLQWNDRKRHLHRVAPVTHFRPAPSPGQLCTRSSCCSVQEAKGGQLRGHICTEVGTESWGWIPQGATGTWVHASSLWFLLQVCWEECPRILIIYMDTGWSGQSNFISPLLVHDLQLWHVFLHCSCFIKLVLGSLEATFK